MALNMYHEARGEGRLGMLAVGWVVLNRMADKAYPKTVAGWSTRAASSAGCAMVAPTVRVTSAWRRALNSPPSC